MKKPSKSEYPSNVPIEFVIEDDRVYPVFKAVAEGSFHYGVPGRDGHHGCYLIFVCPICKSENAHGGSFGKLGAGDGHRVAHCNCWPNGYFIKEIVKVKSS